MRDFIFLAVVIAFFALATLFVAACERIVGRASVAEERQR